MNGLMSCKFDKSCNELHLYRQGMVVGTCMGNCDMLPWQRSALNERTCVWTWYWKRIKKFSLAGS